MTDQERAQEREFAETLSSLSQESKLQLLSMLREIESAVQEERDAVLSAQLILDEAWSDNATRA